MKDILFSNTFSFSCLSRSGLGRSVPCLTLLPQPVRNILALALPSAFTSFYLKDLFFEIDGLRFLGPFVAAGVTVD